jgi:RNA polymerase sigma-70 factor (ECF subfamily)
MTDAEIGPMIDAARRGDRGATDRVLQHVYPGVWKVARRMMGNDHDAADATQNALIAIVAGLARFDGRSAITTWSYRIASNACIDELRRRNRRPDPAEVTEQWSDGVADVSVGVSDRLDIDAALQSLADDHRQIVVLREIVGMDYAEIADHLGVPVGTVRSRLARARGRLADLLAEGNQSADSVVEGGDHG